MPDELDNASAQSLERKLSTILSADVAEFSRLMGEDEEQTLRIFRGHKQIFESLVAMHRGRVFNTAGDAILAEFGSAVEAVRCATEIQAALRTRNDQLPPNRQVRFRIGINLGDVMVQGQDLLGDGVNVAARLQTAAEPGGVCISGSVHDQIRNKLSLSFQSLGERSFKNIQQPVRTFSITEAESGGALPSPKPATKAGGTKWVAAAVLLLAAAGAYWAYTANQSAKSASANPVAAAAQPQSAPPDAKPATGTAVQLTASPNAAQPTPANAAATTPAPAAEPPSKKPDAPRRASVEPTPAKPGASAPAAKPAATTNPDDGLYTGPVCYAATANEPQRCFRAEGTLSGSRITGQWPMGHETGITMFLTGDIAPSGDLKIEMHTEKGDGSRVATIDLKGTFQNRRIAANGSFRRGRGVTLNWHKVPAPQ